MLLLFFFFIEDSGLKIVHQSPDEYDLERYRRIKGAYQGQVGGCKAENISYHD